MTGPEHDTRVVVPPDSHSARCRCGWSSEQPTAQDAAWACWRHVQNYQRRLGKEVRE